MNSIIRVVAAAAKTIPANPSACAEQIQSVLKELEASPADIVVLPKLALCSPSCGAFFHNTALLDGCKDALEELCIATKDYPTYIIVGLAMADSPLPVSAIAVLYQGQILGYIPTQDNPKELSHGIYSDRILPADTLFACGDIRFAILSCDPKLIPVRAAGLTHTGFDLLIAPCYSPVTAGYIDDVLGGICSYTQSVGCAVAVVNGGCGDTSSPYLYKAFAAIYECGKQLSCQIEQEGSIYISSDIDGDIIRSQKLFNNYKAPYHTLSPVCSKRGLQRTVDTSPYLPSDPFMRHRYLSELFDLQVRSLAARLQNTGIKKMVIGVSGGLDSTLALLVMAATADRMGLPRDSIIGITMPGFGTSDRTYYNALGLLEGLEVDSREIPIREAILQHFTDIGHDSNIKDVTYENAQARERTQILLDIANKVGGLVVGTGDLSEAALGWCTFAGDQISNYNVNICITKTVVRQLVRHIANNSIVPGVSAYLHDILATPVSPELLPADEEREITQKTEDILGPYELHDFFLYYLIKHGFRPSKLYYYACIAFSASFTPAFIKEKLLLFLRRLAAGQFKRSAAPDAAILCDVNLSGASFYIPSDLNINSMLEDVISIDF